MQLTFRGGYQFATRAPNTAELFTGPTQTVVSFPTCRSVLGGYAVALG